MNNKLQFLLIDHLQKFGNIKFNLPNNFTLEIGINQVDDNGDLKKIDDYCWIIAKKENGNKTISMDSYNLGFRFLEDEKSIVFKENVIDENGNKVNIYELV